MFEEFFDNIARRAQQPAFTFMQRGKLTVKTYGDFYDDVCRMRAFLPAGKRILLFAPPTYALYAALLAGFAAGDTLILTDDFNDGEFLKGLRYDYVLCCKKTRLLVPLCGLKGPVLVLEQGLKMPPLQTPVKLIEDAPALITFSSGSSGRKKEVVRTLKQLYGQFRFLSGFAHGLSANSRVLCMLPVYPLALLSLGCEILPFFKNPEKKRARKKLAALCDRCLPDAAFGSVSRFVAMEGAQSIKTAFMGGSFCHLKDAESIRSRFGGARFTVIYGASEAAAVCRAELSQYISHLKQGRILLGAAFDGVSVEIIDDELVLSGEVVSGGRHFSGDLGKLEEGQLFYLGKKNLSCRSEGLFNAPIELAVKNEFDVRDAAFVAWEGKSFLLVEGGRADIKALSARFPSFAVLRARLPRDKKHGYKHDYEGLIKIIKRSWT